MYATVYGIVAQLLHCLYTAVFVYATAYGIVALPLHQCSCNATVYGIVTLPTHRCVHVCHCIFRVALPLQRCVHVCHCIWYSGTASTLPYTAVFVYATAYGIVTLPTHS